MEEENTKNNSFDTTQDKQNLYQCKECGLHYRNKDTAEKCEAWCKEHKTCNVEIMKQSEEVKENKLQELEKKCEEYLNNWKRERADFLNYKKEEMERMAMLGNYAREDMILKILSVLDSFYLAEKQLPENLKIKAKESSQQTPQVEWTKGFLQIKKQIEEFLKKEGIEEIQAVGQKFDPNTMEIVEEVSRGLTPAEPPTPDIPGTVVEELQKGYIMDNKVIRPAKVKISK